MLNFFLLFILLSTNTFAKPMTVKEIKAAGYFNKLDYRDAELLPEMTVFENKLMESADEAYTYPKNDPYLKKNSLIFAYTALYLDNLLEAKRFGVLPIPEVEGGKIISQAADAQEEYETRKQLAIRYIERAKELLPEDRRVDLWYYGIKATHVDKSYVNDLLAVAKEEKSTFALMSSIIVTKEMDLEPAQREVITKLVKKFTGVLSPCFIGRNTSQCRSIFIAPFSAQNGIVMMADHRLRISKINTSNRKKKIGRIYSNILYRATGMAWMKATTPYWVNKTVIHERRNLTQKYTTAQEIEDYLKSDNGRIVYGCASCHSQSKETMAKRARR